MSDLSVISRLKAELHDNQWGGSMRALLSAAIVEIERQAIQVERMTGAVDAERKRCADLISAARFDEIERDWRSLVSFIEHGTTVEQLKSFSSEKS